MAERGQAGGGEGAAPYGPMIVWDVPTRLFHWALVVCLVGSYLTGEDGDLDLHQTFGLTVIGLLIFRVLWGFAGSEPSRFSSFLKTPGAVIGYLGALRRGEQPVSLTHNPLGGWSVVALLAVVLLQAGLGLFATDDILFEGPLNDWVSYDMAQTLTGWHHRIFDLVVALVILHLLAVAAYAVFLHTDLVSPMVTGRKMVDRSKAPRERRMAPLWQALLLAAASFGVAFAIPLLG